MKTEHQMRRNAIDSMAAIPNEQAPTEAAKMG
jgi:hypothetical protein